MGSHEEFNAACKARLPADQFSALEVEHHLMDGRRGDAEVALHVAFGRGASVDLTIGPDEGEVLALFSVKLGGVGADGLAS